MHIFEPDRTAIIGPQHRLDLADRCRLETEHAAQIDRLVLLVGGEAMEFRRQVGRFLQLGNAQRIKIGTQMTAHPIGADQHHRADRLFGGFRHVAVRHRRAGLGCRCLDLDAHPRRVERAVQLVGIVDRPVLALPARALLLFRADKILILKTHDHFLGGGWLPAFAGSRII